MAVNRKAPSLGRFRGHDAEGHLYYERKDRKGVTTLYVDATKSNKDFAKAIRGRARSWASGH